MTPNDQSDLDYLEFPDGFDPEWDEDELGDACGRWDNGRLTRFCSMAGTEFCDFDCPYRD